MIHGPPVSADRGIADLVRDRARDRRGRKVRRTVDGMVSGPAVLFPQRNQRLCAQSNQRNKCESRVEWGAEVDGRSVALLPSRCEWRRIVGRNHVIYRQTHTRLSQSRIDNATIRHINTCDS